MSDILSANILNAQIEADNVIDGLYDDFNDSSVKYDGHEKYDSLRQIDGKVDGKIDGETVCVKDNVTFDGEILLEVPKLLGNVAVGQFSTLPLMWE